MPRSTAKFLKEIRLNEAENEASPLKDRGELIHRLRTVAVDYASSKKRVSLQVKIDGQLAAWLLRYNWNNRECQPYHVEKMLGDAAANRFPLMPEPIVFCSYEDETADTFVWDGQTRLQTARMHERGLWFNVDILSMDRELEPMRRACEVESRGRTLRDVNTELKITDENLLDALKSYRYPTLRRRGMVSMPQLLEDNREVGDRVQAALHAFDRLMTAEDLIVFGQYRIGIAIGMLHCFESNSVHATEFFTGFFRPSALPESHCVKVLRRELLTRRGIGTKSSRNERRHPYEIRSLIYLTFQWFAAKRERGQKITDFVFRLIDIPLGLAVPKEMSIRPAEDPEAIEWINALDFSEPAAPEEVRRSRVKA